MSENTILLPPEIEEAVNKRNQIWATLDRDESEASRLRGMKSKIENRDTVAEIAPLTADQAPPAELSAAIKKVEQELAEATRLQQAIKSSENEIRTIEEGYKTAMTWLVIGIIILIVVLFIMFAG